MNQSPSRQRAVDIRFSSALLVTLLGCQTEDPSVRTKDGGSDSSEAGVLASSDGMSASTSSGGSTGSLSCDGSAAVWNDAARSGACDGGGSRTDVANEADAMSDPEAPPTHCVAPCVWDLMKRCRVRKSCTSQQYAGGTFGPNWVTCSPENHVWKITTEGHIGAAYEYFVDDCPCYTFSAGLTGTTGGAWQTTVEEWRDALGHSVARGVVASGSLAGTVVCGTIDPSTGTPVGPTYDVDPTSSDCAPWFEPQCDTGCCGVPPKVPISPY